MESVAVSIVVSDENDKVNMKIDNIRIGVRKVEKDFDQQRIVSLCDCQTKKN